MTSLFSRTVHNVSPGALAEQLQRELEAKFIICLFKKYIKFWCLENWRNLSVRMIDGGLGQSPQPQGEFCNFLEKIAI